MATVDDKVVAMSFESSKFESGVNKTIESLDKLKNALKFPNAGKGLDDLNASAKNVDLSHIGSAVDSIKSKFSALSVAGLAIFANLAQNAVSSAARLVKSFSLQPVLDGFQEYATNLNSIQTVLANTQAQGTTLNDVNKALLDLNHYSDKTIYNFSQMAKNIGTFTAAGVGLNQATQSIKGIANLAALSGSNAEQASSAMYQLSQAIAAGAVKLQDWNSVVNAGMGGEVFQKALFNTGKAMGTLTGVPVGQTFEEWKKAGNSFRQSLSATAKDTTSSTSAISQAQKDAAKSVSDAQQASAESVANAAKSVRDAQAGVSQASKQGASDVATAMQEQSDVVKKSAEDVKTALEGVREARKRLAEAMKPPSKDELQAAADNLKTAQLDQADLSTAVTDAQTEQKRSAEDLAAAQKKLADLQTSGTASPEEILAAQRAVEDGQKRVTDAADAQERALLQQNAATRSVDQAEKDLQTTREKGTKKDQNVKDAQDALTASLEQYKDAQLKAKKDISDAEDNVKETQIKSAAAQKKAGQELADAEKSQAKTIRDAQQSVADAHEQAAERINQARDSISQKAPTSWLTSDVLTSTLRQFTGDMTDAQLAAQGFSKEQIKAIQLQAKTAQDAATKVKTLSQLIDTAKETAGSGWAQTWQIIFGDFGEARKTFTDASNAIDGFINQSSNARIKVLTDWKALGGRTVLIEAIKNAFEDLGAVIKPIKDAFRDIFPAKTGKDLFELTKQFEHFTEILKIGPEAANDLKRTFRGLFALLDIGKQIIGGIFTVFGKLFGAVTTGGAGFLDLTGNIGDFIVSVDEALKKGDRLKNFFEGVGNVLAAPIALLAKLRNAIFSLFGGFDEKASAGISTALGNMHNALTPMQKVVEAVSNAWDRFLNGLDGADKIFKPVIDAIVGLFQGLGPAISSAIGGMNFEAILQVIRTGLFGGIYLMFRKFLGKGSLIDQLGGSGGGVLGKLNGAFEGLTGTLKSMQTNIKADTLMKIAIAIGVLTASIVALSFVDPKKLNTAMAGIAIAMGELLGAMAILDKISTGAGFLKMPFITASMIALAIAVDLLTLAVMGLSRLSWEELMKGLGGVAALLVSVSLAVKPLSANSAGMITAGAGIIAIALAMKILASAVADFGAMNLGTLAKGLGSVAVGLGAIALASKLFPPGMIAIGAGLIAVGFALKLIATAVQTFGGMEWKTIGKGLVGIAGSLVAIGAAMNLMPPGMVVMAAGLILVGIALKGIASAVQTFGGMSMTAMAKGIGALAASLLVLSTAMYAMQGSMGGAIALTAVSAGLALLAPALVALGKQSWSSILKGLVGLAGAFVVLGVAGALLGPVAPAILALGLALTAVGAGLALAGAGVALIGLGLSAIAVAGPTAIGILLKALQDMVQAIPKFAENLVLGLLSMVQALAKTAPQFVDALVKILNSLVDAVIQIAPKLGEAFDVLLKTAIKVVENEFPLLVQLGLDMLMALIRGVTNNISKIISMAVQLVVTIVTAIGQHGADLVTAGYKALLAFISGIANNLASVISSAVSVVVNFAKGIADNIGKIITAATSIVTSFIKVLSDNAVKFVTEGANAIVSFVTGIGNNIGKVVKAATDFAGKFMDTLANSFLSLIDKAGQVILNFLEGLRQAILKYEPQIIEKGTQIGWALVQGIYNGLKNNVKKVYDFIKKMAEKVIHKVTHLFGILSPSTVFYDIGENLMLGLAYGVDENAGIPVSSVEDMTSTMVDTMSAIPDALTGLVDMEPVIAPVLDLTNVQAGADQLDGMINTAPVVAATSFGQASAISTEQAAQSTDADVVAPGATSIKFEQNNYSPEALSDVEIYRQTKNQIAQMRVAIAN